MATQQARPYRSHRVPACDKCRQRKVRCNILIAGTPCQLCETRGFACLFSDALVRAATDADAGEKQAERPLKRARRATSDTQSKNDDDADGPSSSARPARLERQATLEKPNASTTAESSIIIAPMVAEDVQILLRHLETNPSGKRPSQTYTIASSVPGKPVLHMAIPRAREGSRPSKDPGRSQRAILEQILGPFAEQVVHLYFDHVHPCFPVVDEEAFGGDSSARIPSSLYCQIYAISLTYWNRSEILKSHPCPSSQYFWESAIAALQEDFSAPHLATLYPALIDLSGRPLGAIQGNVVNAGRTVALAHSLGLNRDPRVCSIPQKDIHLRIRLFWAVLIHDHWSSFAYGVPPSVLRRQYDVPLPVLSDLMTPNKHTRERKAGARCFTELCRLSQILGDILPLVYDLSEPRKDVWKDLRRFECSLDQWEERLPAHFKQTANENVSSGASSLHLGYLSIRLLLSRLRLRTASQENNPDRDTTTKFYMSAVRGAAIQIADFVCSLEQANLKEFWMPYTAHLLVSAGTVLLRCAVDTTEAAVIQSCKDALAALQKRLRRAREEDKWDLADMFIKRCDDPISKILAEPAPDSGEAQSSSHASRVKQAFSLDLDVFDTPESASIYMPMEPLESLWDPLWDVWQTNLNHF
ncbi:C6 transcription factor [Phyllosticta capitalensis]|uniref:C6 transcription factor n=1 Tax=Phyllosticta capitalensis TaxID=121624 RepID=A0ABR1YG02_9PEZI